MPNLNPKNFSNPETLRKIRTDLLLAWLKPAAGYLEKNGVLLPKTDADGVRPSSVAATSALMNAENNMGTRWNASLPFLDYDKLARLFMEPEPDMPADLAESLFLIHEMANPSGMDFIIESAEANGLNLGLGDDVTPADVAVQAWLLDRQLLENLHNCQEVTRPRSFRYFSTNADPLPPFDGPTAEQLAELETRLGIFYEAWKRGQGARVFAYPHPSSDVSRFTFHASRPPAEWWFLVRHGAPCRREGAMEHGQPTSIFYRPQSHDVLVYDPARGEMRINCCTARERRVLLRLFGSCLFGRNDFFPGTAKYTLAPLVWRGRDCLACADVPAIERVNLTEVEFYHADAPWQRVTRKAEDIFELIERAEVRWPAKIEQITRATFEVKFWQARRPRRLTLVPCNKAQYGRDEDSTVLEQWLAAREFIVTDA